MCLNCHTSQRYPSQFQLFPTLCERADKRRTEGADVTKKTDFSPPYFVFDTLSGATSSPSWRRLGAQVGGRQVVKVGKCRRV